MSEKVRVLVDGKVICKTRDELISEFMVFPPRGIDLLRVLAVRPMTVYGVSDSLHLSVPTVRTLLRICVHRGYVLNVGRASKRILYAATEKALEVIGGSV